MDYKNKTGNYYNVLRIEMLQYLPDSATKILVVGCGTGVFAEAVKKKNNAEVWGIELMDFAAKEASKILDKVLSGPCEEHISSLPKDYFDAIYFNDVLEHLIDPYSVLADLKSNLSENGVIISSIPNVRYHGVLRQLLFEKNWKYENHGVLDKTHLRFFTKKSIKDMYENAGYTIEKHQGINKTRSLKPWFYNLLFLFTQMDMFFVQYATVVKKSEVL